MAGPLVEDVHKYQDKTMCLISLQDDLDKLLLGALEYQQKCFICLQPVESGRTLESGLLTN